MACPAGTFQYRVVSGDTFFKIALKFGTTEQAIRAANPGVDPNRLQIGQVICVPNSSGVTCPTGTFSHVIASGDTCFLLAQRFGTTVNAIQAANPGLNCNNLQVGRTICIPRR